MSGAAGSTIGLHIILGIAAAVLFLIAGLVIIDFVVLSSVGAVQEGTLGEDYYGGDYLNL